MTNAGWYPDPAGAPDTYRYWDGQSWSQMTTSQPPVQQQPAPPQPATQYPTQGGYGAVPPPPAPIGYGQPQQWSPQPAGGSGGGSGKLIGLIVAGVLALVLLGVAGFFGVRALSDNGDDKASDDPSRSESGSEQTDGSDSTDPSTDSSEGSTSGITPTGIQCTGGNPTPETDPGEKPKDLVGGGLVLPRLSGFVVDIDFSDAFSFADDIIIQYAYVTDNWVSEYAVGGLPRANGFTSPEQAAEIVMQCLTMNDRVYSGFESRTDLKSEPVTIDGMTGHSVTSEIRVNDPKVTVEGDVTTVIVLDGGDPDTYGLYIGVAPIGDTAKIAQAERLVKRIKAD